MNNKILTKHYASPCGKILLGSFKDKASNRAIAL